MREIRKFIREELSGWKKWEVAWLLAACTVIAVLSIYWQDTIMEIISATTGVACVVCAEKGKLSALYYFPMQFYGFYVWKNHCIDGDYEESYLTARKLIGEAFGI